jgi:phosphoadenosine phosphosulfate reductase
MSMTTTTLELIETLQERSQGASAQELLAWAVSTYGASLKLACSLGLEDVALAHMLTRIDPEATVFVLDTGRLHFETLETMERLRSKFGIRFQVFAPETRAVEALVAAKGPLSFYESVENRKECCSIRKVEPLNRALRDAKAWVTGLRRTQSSTRTSLKKLEIDADHGGILKLNPLADWDEDAVWKYVKENGIPYNSLHDQGFPSIGCAPCTRAIAPGEDIRAGRWWWESPENKECGLHVRKRPAGDQP